MKAPANSALSISAAGLLGEFHAVGALTWADLHPARHLCQLYGETDERVALAVALAVRALRGGSVCLAFDQIREAALAADDEAVVIPERLWPEQASWVDALQASPAVAVGDEASSGRPLRLIGQLLYLERYWQEEEKVRRALQGRQGTALATPDAALRADRLHALFPGEAEQSQRAAAARCLTSPLTVIAGGPGTGKTTTIARILALLLEEDPTRRVALAAPTGKAAARMDDALRVARTRLAPADAARLTGLSASTLHRLLGWTPEGRSRFVHNADNPLPHDVVVVDELSMVSLSLMSRLLEAVGPTTRLILVGDPDQLASVEAGAVLADITRARWGAPADSSPQPAADGTPTVAGTGPVVHLRHNFRFSGKIGELAAAIRAGDADRALALLHTGGEITLTLPGASLDGLRERVVASGNAVAQLAADDDLPAALAALDGHRLLCAHRQGPYGVARWARIAEAWLRAGVTGFGTDGEWYTGRPLLMTRNSAELGLYNGDTGLVVRVDDQPRVFFPSGHGVRSFSPYLLEGAQTIFAMTVHKAQGGQFGAVSLILPAPDSPLLTRELLYTAVTRATGRVDLIGAEEAVRRAIDQPARRASGLRERL